MIKKESRNEMRLARHKRIRENLSGTSTAPRLNVFRSNKNIFAQIIDDEARITLVSASSIDKELKLENGGNIEAATKVGALLAKRAKDKKIKKVTFDRGGYQYHGRVQALADAARENGLEF
jgi:large subunit ribosomal protein L18